MTHLKIYDEVHVNKISKINSSVLWPFKLVDLLCTTNIRYITGMEEKISTRL